MRLILIVISLVLSAATMAESIKIDDGGLIATPAPTSWYATLKMPPITSPHSILGRLSTISWAHQQPAFERIGKKQYAIRVYLPGNEQYCEFSASASFLKRDPRMRATDSTYQILHTFSKKLSHRSSELAGFCDQYDNLTTLGVIKFHLHQSSKNSLERTLLPSDERMGLRVTETLYKVISSGD